MWCKHTVSRLWFAWANQRLMRRRGLGVRPGIEPTLIRREQILSPVNMGVASLFLLVNAPRGRLSELPGTGRILRNFRPLRGPDFRQVPDNAGGQSSPAAPSSPLAPGARARAPDPAEPAGRGAERRGTWRSGSIARPRDWVHTRPQGGVQDANARPGGAKGSLNPGGWSSSVSSKTGKGFAVRKRDRTKS